MVTDRGYCKGEEILACEEAGITTYLPKPQTSGNLAKGRFGGDRNYTRAKMESPTSSTKPTMTSTNVRRVSG